MSENYNNISYETKLAIAKDILKECTWNNTMLTPQDVIKMAEKKDSCKLIFSMIFENSRSMYEHLRLIKREWIVELIKAQRIGRFKEKYFQRRKDVLICFFIDSSHKVEGLSWR